MNDLSPARKKDVIQGTILVVDDTPSNLTLVSRILSSRGFRILLADNGLAAIQIAIETIPDIILLDITMPEMDGYETCEKLKAINRTDHIPVIFISSLDGIEDKIRALKSALLIIFPNLLNLKKFWRG